MLRSIKEMIGYALGATDGYMGKVDDFLLDDQEWVVRYLVADTGHWLSGRQVILSPSVLGHADWETRIMPVELTRDQVRHSPSIEADRPVDRQKEMELARHYGWPMYWNPSMAAAGGGILAGPMMAAPSPDDQEVHQPEMQGDPHLRSAREIMGYHVEATDGESGHVEDFIIDDAGSWNVQYLVVDTKNWWPSKKVLMLPMWISEVNWDLRSVRFELPMETIRNGPEYDPSAPVNEERELRFYDYYGRPHNR